MLVLVLGPRRSGTSALAGALESSGLPFGPASREASPHNPNGHFDNPAVDAINSALLAPYASQLTAVHAQVERAVHTIFGLYPDAPLVGMKSHEMVWTYPVWLRHVVGIRFIATIRHPINVASSVRARLTAEGRHVPETRDLLRTCETYYSRLLALWQTVRFPILDFDLPFADYVDQLDRSCGAIGLRLSDAVRSGFLSERLRHHRCDDALPEPLATIYVRLRSFASEHPASDLLLGSSVIDEAPLPDDLLQISVKELQDMWSAAHQVLAETVCEQQRVQQLLDSTIPAIQAEADREISARDAEILRLQAELQKTTDIRDQEIRRLQGLLGQAPPARIAATGDGHAIRRELLPSVI